MDWDLTEKILKNLAYIVVTSSNKDLLRYSIFQCVFDFSTISSSNDE
ncbi:hypothetical protein [Bacillus sp. TH25]|nr:hypothetical protein [Bacillus sp. TH25]MBK5429718.1 hypothetical protein [Bacillus sp. TH25]